ncbi:hypothetical protein EK904_013879 [Melospiza melodia maxima]|nr:hypothetical protein EK904_013879 [Melospiza melodia maxima]
MQKQYIISTESRCFSINVVQVEHHFQALLILPQSWPEERGFCKESRKELILVPVVTVSASMGKRTSEVPAGIPGLCGMTPATPLAAQAAEQTGAYYKEHDYMEGYQGNTKRGEFQEQCWSCCDTSGIKVKPNFCLLSYFPETTRKCAR